MLIRAQLARHNKELAVMLKPGVAIGEGDEALECYAKHTAQIEVTMHRYNRTTTKRMMFVGKPAQC